MVADFRPVFIDMVEPTCEARDVFAHVVQVTARAPTAVSTGVATTEILDSLCRTHCFAVEIDLAADFRVAFAHILHHCGVAQILTPTGSVEHATQ